VNGKENLQVKSQQIKYICEIKFLRWTLTLKKANDECTYQNEFHFGLLVLVVRCCRLSFEVIVNVLDDIFFLLHQRFL